MSERGEVLVAILNNREDFRIARDEHWYRIPVSSQQKWLKKCWPPAYLAFYHTKNLGRKAHAIHYYAEVLDVKEAYRWQLFPEHPLNDKSYRQYYQLLLGPLQELPHPIYSRRMRRLGPLQELPHPIYSRRMRRIIFIPTTLEKFRSAAEINDLYDESPLEDRLWAIFKRHNIEVYRQEYISVKEGNYFLDFAVYCVKGKLNIETDGDTYHTNKDVNYTDNLRDNALRKHGWTVLRFNTRQVMEEMETYTLPTIVDVINDTMDGIKIDDTLSRKIDLHNRGKDLQTNLFDSFDNS